MGVDKLKLFEIVIIFCPHTNGIIIAATDQGAVIDPLHAFDIVGVSFQDIFALVLVGCGVELPYPDVFVPAARGDFLVGLVPVDAFHLLITKQKYLILVSL